MSLGTCAHHATSPCTHSAQPRSPPTTPTPVRCHCHRQANLVWQVVSWRVRCQDSLVRVGALMQHLDESIIPAAAEPHVAVNLQRVGFITQQLLGLVSGPARSFRRGAWKERHPHLFHTARVSDEQQVALGTSTDQAQPHGVHLIRSRQRLCETLCVFRDVILSTKPNKHAVWVTGLVEKVADGVLALRITVADNAHEHRSFTTHCGCRPSSGSGSGSSS